MKKRVEKRKQKRRKVTEKNKPLKKGKGEESKAKLETFEPIKQRVQIN